MQSINFKGISKVLSSRNKTKTTAVAIIALLAISAVIAILPAAFAAVPTRVTIPYLDVQPKLIGLDQPLLVNIFIFPPPEDALLFAQGDGFRFENLTITFTKPDGTTDSFMPQEGNNVLPPGMTDRLGTLWLYYYPDQTGNWSVKYSMPGQTIAPEGFAVYYEGATSPTTTFAVQEDMVQLGFPPAPLPTDYWAHPINANNREWSQISGDWLQPYYDGYGGFYGSGFNPYSNGPDSPHILWRREVSMGGIIGGDWGSLSYTATGGTPAIIISGKLYCNDAGSSPATFSCVDLRTGEKLWTAPGTVTIGQHLQGSASSTTLEQTANAATRAILWGLETSQWKQYNPFNGAVLRTITNVPAGASSKSRWSDGSEIVYAAQNSGFNATTGRFAVNNFIKWNLTMVPTSGTGANDWTKGIVWNVTLRQPDGFAPGDGRGSYTIHIAGHNADADVAVLCAQNNENKWLGVDLNTGTILYEKTVDYIPIAFVTLGDIPNVGPFMAYDSDRMLYAYDMSNGREMWKVQVGDYPWGVNTFMRNGLAYGTLYSGSFDGHVWGVDIETGEITFKSDFAGNTPAQENPYGTWAHRSLVIADGKIYTVTSEHSPTAPLMRGNKIYCFDAQSGKMLWNTSNGGQSLAIAEGYLIAPYNENDGYTYCFGKGQTAITISAPLTTVTAGTGVLIQGTVMDLSPGQPNTPAVSEADMSTWMQYLHQQDAALVNNPPVPNGVPVELRALGSDGALVDLGTVTSNSYGQFSIMWTPPKADKYTVYAAFAGSDSYWSSSAATALGVEAAQETGTNQPQTTVPDNMPMFVASTAAIIVAIAIVGILMLRKGKQ